MPGLDRLGELLEQVRAAGMPVELVGRRRARGGSIPGIELSAYRIIQEALTNTLKHARGAPRQVARPATARTRWISRSTDDGGTGDRGISRAGRVRPRPHRHARAGRGVRRSVRGRVRAGRVPRVAPRLPIDATRPRRPRDMPIRVLLVDDQQLVRTGFRMILADEPDIEVVGEAADGKVAVESVRRLEPDVVVMDIRMPVMDGVEATRRIVEDPAPTARVLVLTTFDADEYVVEALRAGASGFLLKDVPPADFVEAIRTSRPAMRCWRRRSRASCSTASGTDYPGPADPRQARFRELTERELEVLKLVARGLSNREIAERLVLAEPTVKTHVSHVLLKLELRDRAQAVVARVRSRARPARAPPTTEPAARRDRPYQRMSRGRDPAMWSAAGRRATRLGPAIETRGRTTRRGLSTGLCGQREPPGSRPHGDHDDQSNGDLHGRPHQALSRRPGPDRPDPRRAGRLDLRLPRPEWRRQVDHPQDPRRPDPADGGNGNRRGHPAQRRRGLPAAGRLPRPGARASTTG